MTRPLTELRHVKAFVDAGLNDCEIARATGIPRGTIKDWRHGSRDHLLRPGRPSSVVPRLDCPICEGGTTDPRACSYLLGVYLGDGMLSAAPRGVFKLRVVLDTRYQGIIRECRRAISAVRPVTRMAVNQIPKVGCVEVTAYWKHWPCLFPQHGPGPKHLRKIELAFWQEYLLERFPRQLLRGLIHSDGCRSLNVVNGKAYPRYQFTNNSAAIRDIFCRACDITGIRWRQMNWKTISVARRLDVTHMDLFIGPKDGWRTITSPTLFPF
ncbi:MAG: hypothetical protein M3391_05855 [Actinomycetota bacterium]|nr:hypothetical protein [Actinomycetota bacterium]